LTTQEVLSILEFVHSQGVIHRDIKPNNLIRHKQDNKLVLLDLALSSKCNPASHSSGTATASIAIGTPGYMPTEQGKASHPNSDIMHWASSASKH